MNNKKIYCEKIEKIIPSDVLWIIDMLENRGYEAYAVGGCVRDCIMGETPKDWDITTSAKPMEVKSIFRKTIDTGLQHGTVTVRKGGESYEVTTYRIDGDYSDGRHPDSVEFTSDLKEDLKRRDFTINAMAYNPKNGIIDEFGGIEDLERKVIKCVGVAHERFTEDALRILRAVRFAARFGFEIDDETLKAMEELAPNLELISKERIQAELDKLLVSSHPEMFRILYETGITKVIMPAFDEMMNTEQNTPYHDSSVGEHTLKVLVNIKNDRYLRWAALFHDMGKPLCKTTDEEGVDHFKGHAKISSDMARKELRNLKFDNDTVDVVTKVVACHSDLTGSFPNTDKALRRVVSRIGKKYFPYFLELFEADLNGKSEYGKARSIDTLNFAKEGYKRILEREDALEIKDLKITGNDLIKLGMKPGVQMGECLKHLLEVVVDEPELNTYEQLETIVKEKYL